MGISREFSREINSITNQFEISRKNGSLKIGMFDSKVKSFICRLLEKMIEEFDNDSEYYNYMAVMDEFIERMHLSSDGSDWMVWSNVDFSKLNELSLGSKDEVSKLKEVRDFYC